MTKVVTGYIVKHRVSGKTRTYDMPDLSLPGPHDTTKPRRLASRCADKWDMEYGCVVASVQPIYTEA